LALDGNPKARVNKASLANSNFASDLVVGGGLPGDNVIIHSRQIVVDEE
jgi:hypothetical protein